MSDMGNFSSIGPVQFGSIDGGAPISHVTSDSAAMKAELGARVIYKGEEYVYFHNVMANTAMAVGELGVQSALSGYSLTNATTLAADLPLVTVKHAAVPSAGFGWGLVRGVAEALKIENTAATGVLLGVGSGGVAISLLVGSFPTGPCIGKVLSSGTGTCKAYVRLFG
jgi:hypothetical protein